MKTLFLIVTGLCALAMILSPAAAFAQMTPMSQDQLQAVTGQAGISIQADQLGLDVNMKTLYYGDTDGTGDGQAGYLSLCGVALKGSVAFGSPATVSLETGPTLFGATPVTSVNLAINNMTLKVDQFSIDAIRVGNAPGTGKSFGSIGIQNMVAQISGNVQMWAH